VTGSELKAFLYPRVNPTSRHWYAYDVVFDGARILIGSHDPEHDLARALLAKGIKGKVTIHDGNTGKPRTIVNIEKAAGRYADDVAMKFRKWKPMDPVRLRRYTAESH
jgi:hypothetical protein